MGALPRRYLISEVGRANREAKSRLELPSWWLREGWGSVDAEAWAQVIELLGGPTICLWRWWGTVGDNVVVVRQAPVKPVESGLSRAREVPLSGAT